MVVWYMVYRSMMYGGMALSNTLDRRMGRRIGLLVYWFVGSFGLAAGREYTGGRKGIHGSPGGIAHSVWIDQHGQASMTRSAWPGQHGRAALSRLALRASTDGPALPSQRCQQCRLHWDAERLQCYSQHSRYVPDIFDGICSLCGRPCAPGGRAGIHGRAGGIAWSAMPDQHQHCRASIPWPLYAQPALLGWASIARPAWPDLHSQGQHCQVSITR